MNKKFENFIILFNLLIILSILSIILTPLFSHGEFALMLPIFFIIFPLFIAFIVVLALRWNKPINRNNNKIITIISIIIFILVIIFLYSFFIATPLAKLTKSESICSTAFYKESCISEVSRSGGIVDCSKIERDITRQGCYLGYCENNNIQKDRCVIEIAIEKNDKSICDEFKNPRVIIGSFRECITEFAIAKNDPSLCPLLEEYQGYTDAYQIYNDMCLEEIDNPIST